MTAPITPDERAAMRERARNLRDLALNAEATATENAYSAHVPRLLDALDTAEAEVAQLREEAASVRPDREAVARAMYVNDLAHGRVGESWGDLLPETRTWYIDQADAVLDLWPGESRATVQAEALRDAAAAAVAQDNNQGDWWDDDRQTYGTPVDWLRARADRLEKGADRG